MILNIIRVANDLALLLLCAFGPLRLCVELFKHILTQK